MNRALALVLLGLVGVALGVLVWLPADPSMPVVDPTLRSSAPSDTTQRNEQSLPAYDFAPSAFERTDLRSLFDVLDDAVNGGAGYSAHINSDGFPTGALLAWSESYLMQAYAEMFRATGDPRYLETLRNHSFAVLGNRDDVRGQADYKGDLVPAWGTDRYTSNGEWKHFLAHTGMITFPMLELVQLVRMVNVVPLLDDAEAILDQVEEAVQVHDEQWVIQDDGQGLYTFSEAFYGIKNYVCPLSQQACMGRALLILWDLTGDEEYLIKATAIAHAIDGSLIQTEQDKLVLGIFAGQMGSKNPVADISHSTVTFHFMELCWRRGIVFTDERMRELAVSVAALLRRTPVPARLDGTGDGSMELTAAQFSFLAPFEPELAELCAALLMDRYRIEVTGRLLQEDWWGTMMLSLARLVGIRMGDQPT